MAIKYNHLPKGLKWTNPFHFLAIGFGSGASPIMPGTMGTVMAIPIYLLLRMLSLPAYTLILAAMICFGFWICDIADKAAGVHDHPSIVWDEIVGYLLTMWAIPTSWISVILGFLLFRLFDIWKPWPIKWVNEKVGGGVGVVADDLLAGIFAWIVLAFVSYRYL
jgi:phosphatidylglycerophosphatase A